MKHLKIIVEGRVQGVYFRAYTLKTAKQLDITGTVKNCADGSVEIHAAGEEQNMQQFVHWCHKGPLLANVKTITLTPEHSPSVYIDFTIVD